MLVIKAYKTFRDRAPYPASKMVGHLEGQFAFVLFDRCTKTVFTATVSSIQYFKIFQNQITCSKI